MAPNLTPFPGMESSWGSWSCPRSTGPEDAAVPLVSLRAAAGAQVTRGLPVRPDHPPLTPNMGINPPPPAWCSALCKAGGSPALLGHSFPHGVWQPGSRRSERCRLPQTGHGRRNARGSLRTPFSSSSVGPVCPCHRGHRGNALERCIMPFGGEEQHAQRTHWLASSLRNWTACFLPCSAATPQHPSAVGGPVLHKLPA